MPGRTYGSQRFSCLEWLVQKELVYAFEPSLGSYQYLPKNIEMHGLSNVISVAKALAGKTGYTSFNMDGTMASGMESYVVYKGTGKSVQVPTVTIADAREEFGSVPSYVKMDIEGAEVEVIGGSAAFLKTHPVHFAIETAHVVDGRHTYEVLDCIFPPLGYDVWSSKEFKIWFTWAAAQLRG